MNFCKNCNNLYYLKIDTNDDNKESNKLIFYCRNCGNEENNLTENDICVSSIENKQNDDNYESYINEYTKLDPTLPRTNNIKCPNNNCDTNKKEDKINREIIYVRYNNIDMKYVYMCSTCNTIWKTNVNN
tara:strand:- start:47 stop:436 length:390 start_codon:yes stop_codon:yes gene_type:complete